MRAKFPIPPAVVSRVLRAVADPESEISDLARLLETDAVLSAKILKTVNSAWFGLDHKVGSVERAVMLMGTHAVRNIVLSLCVRDLMPTKELAGFALESFWEASLRRGAACRFLAQRVGRLNVEEYFTLGLCQDLGLLALLQEDKTLAERLRGSSSELSDKRFELERDSGPGHGEIGFAMFTEWLFPESLTVPVRYHHCPDQAPEPWAMAARVAHAAEAFTDVGLAADKRAALEAASGRLRALGVSPNETPAILEQMNGLVAEYAELMDLTVQKQQTYEEILSVASVGLADLNSSYEQMNRQLSTALAEKQRMAEELERLNRHLDALAKTDSLTALPNRRAFDDAIVRELAVAFRQRSALSLLMLDIDHFKTINDLHGHAAGDRVLEEIGRTLRALARQSDTVARFGGEEIAFLLPFTNAAGARLAAERFRRAIEDCQIPWMNGLLRVTVSVGGATVDAPESASAATAAAFVKSADDALYGAKARGRNRVHWSDRSLAAV